MDRCWHGLKLSGASGHTTMNAGFVVMTMITMMMVMIRRKARTIVMGSLCGFPKNNPKWEPKGQPTIETKRRPRNENQRGNQLQKLKGFPKIANPKNRNYKRSPKAKCDVLG